MKRLLAELRSRWPEYLLEILVIVVGISLSFLLAEWRDERRNRATEKESLARLQADLRIDKAKLEEQCMLVDMMAKANDGLLKYDADTPPPAERLNMAIDLAGTYSYFTPSDIGYRELQRSGSLHTIRNRKLVERIIALYQTGFAMISEWNEIDRRFILERFLPYIDDNAPYAPGPDAGHPLDGTSIMESLHVRDSFKNLLRTGRMTKAMTKQVYEVTIRAIDSTLSDIEKELAALSAE